jgi:carbon-monoxide dehydrogenase small subunit
MSDSMTENLSESVLVRLRVNGALHEIEVSPTASLLDVLRDQLGLTATHMGCMTGHCGACTVMIDGRTAKSCLTMAATVDGREIATLEGLSKSGQPLHPVQQAFWDAGGFQCGYCAPGMVLTTVELLQDTPAPTEAEIRDALAGNLCRCTGYQSIIRAVKEAAKAVGPKP